MTADIDIPVSDFLTASGERWPITESMTLSEEDRAALRDQIAAMRKPSFEQLRARAVQIFNAQCKTNGGMLYGGYGFLDKGTRNGLMHAARAEMQTCADRLQSKLDSAQVKP